jgi:hypothetical protein
VAGVVNTGGGGGTGLCSSITGQRVFYAGGGGGSRDFSLYATYYNATGLGVAGGGDAGSIDGGAGTAGLANTGGGGGGGANHPQAAGGAGGSGIVIIRYPANCAPPASTTNLQQVLYNNGFQIYIFTSNGTITF